MVDERPDPELLLARIREVEGKARRGRLKIFFGACAGVGKTFAMLSAAHQQKRQGSEILIGIVETHGRQETEALVAGLPRLELKEFPHRGRILREFDLDGALSRRPQLILMDELAHSNVAGSRHPKRWQDVEELLVAGIDVYTTVNVQHLESLNDVVGAITGIRVWETVPDRVFDSADEVVLVDLPPEELLQRLRDGKVYLPQQAERAIQSFFRKGNLLALRELALRRTADRVDDDVRQYRETQSGTPVWKTRDALLACIDVADGDGALLRSTARLAAQLDIPWHAVFVEEASTFQRNAGQRRQNLYRLLHLAEELGAETAALSGHDRAQEVVRYARAHNLSKVVVGRDAQAGLGGWRSLGRLWPGTLDLVERLGQLAPELDILLVTRGQELGPVGEEVTSPRPESLRGYLLGALACVGTTFLAMPLHAVFDLANIVMLFLLAVVGVAMAWGRGPAVLASFLSVAAFDFFFVPPKLSFAVSDVQYLLTFAVMLAVGLVTGQLTAGLRYQVRVATGREARVRALYDMSRELSAVLMTEQVEEISHRFLAAEFDATAAILLADEAGRLGVPPASAPPPLSVDLAVAQWAYDHGAPAGRGTDTLPAGPVLYLPLQAPMRTRGVLALAFPESAPRRLLPEQRRLLETFARLMAISLERIHYVEVAQATTVQMESERLRNALLAAISHDLRTPLGVLVSLAESLTLTQPALSPEQAGIALAMVDEARHMGTLADNLLDMARLQSGAVSLNLAWLPLEEVVGGAVKSLGGALDRHPLKISLPEELPLLNVDAVLLERVFCNLLENAIKYTPPGTGLGIGAAVEAERVRVWVDDGGPGLPPGREEDIFQKFERGVRESTTPGVGLGLALCRAIIQVHGGTIQGGNRRDTGGAVQGARFEFTLPRGTPPSVPTALDEGAESMEAAGGEGA